MPLKKPRQGKVIRTCAPQGGGTMPRIGIQDRALFTVTELELIHSSFPSSLKTLSRGRVKAQISRTRKYSEKYRNLAREQHRAKKKSGKCAAQPGSNVRTERKAQIFTDTLNRFEKRLGQLERQEQRKNTLQMKQPRVKTRQSARQTDTKPRKKTTALRSTGISDRIDSHPTN